ncbi:glycosyltransferase [Aureibaculum sp. A20]|uniref:Glycosyltransferase n=1 Tax=Aureibaculum flavum TaxID=2795986 RepID=A0ABS0WKV1_9FLAO|nr:glycosyltransferase [Aureibaculum flavum]MBJ2172610.1 glycosyltransferase [Aureibaculum flavum]
MKILFFIESLGPGGKERRLVELIKNLSKNSKYIMEIVLTNNTLHYKEILDCNVKVHCIIRKRFKKDPRLFYKFYKIAKKFKPDVIHVWGNLVAIYAIPAKVLLNIPLINNQIANVPNHKSNSLMGPRTSFKYSDLILANSFAGMEAYGAPQEKSKVIYNGFDFNRINKLEDSLEVKKRLNITTDKIVVMVASYSANKDYKTYIEVAKEVLKSRNDVTFVAVGGGNNEIYKKDISGFEDRIMLLGRHANVENIMNTADIGVLCTYTEGISNALLEFMALGKPVVITGGGGCVELVEHGQNGYLFEASDKENLSAAIHNLLKEPKLMMRQGERSKQIIKEKFSIDKMMESYADVYREFEN